LSLAAGFELAAVALASRDGIEQVQTEIGITQDTIGVIVDLTPEPTPPPELAPPLPLAPSENNDFVLIEPTPFHRSLVASLA